MKQYQYKLMTLIAMIPLVFAFGTVNAESVINKSEDTGTVQQSIQSNAKATVLAKGQNNLPKHERTDCPQS
jgi:hypothetical protein